jgi:hypothetical protein
MPRLRLGLNDPACLRVHAGRPGGMSSGKPSATLALQLPDGSVVIARASLHLFLEAAAADIERWDSVNAAHYAFRRARPERDPSGPIRFE